MKKIAAFFSIMIALFCLTGQSHASGLLGAEIDYQPATVGVYVVTYRAYYDCRVANVPDSVQFSFRPQCSPERTFRARRSAVDYQQMNPYCATTGNSCSSNSLLNIKVISYATTIAFTTAEFQCHDFVVSVKQCPGPAAANLQTSGNNCLYVEATIKVDTNVSNQAFAPRFLPTPTLFATLNTPTAISNLVEQDLIDSVSFSFKQALSDANAPLSYNAGYFPWDPLPSSSGVQLDPRTGTLTFTPSVHQTSTAAGASMYTVVIEAAGYQKVNGKMIKNATVQRQVPIFVDNTSNLNPEIINVTANGQPVQPNGIITIQAGSTLNLQFATADANAADSVTIVFPAQSPYRPWNPGFSTTGGTRPMGTITYNTNSTWEHFFYFPIIVKDNACPVRGVTAMVYGLNVVANPTGLKESRPKSSGFSVFPNPFTTEVNFSLAENKAEHILIYNVLGREVDRIELKELSTSEQTISWPNAGKFAAGTYIAKLISANKTVQTLKFTKLQ